MQCHVSEATAIEATGAITHTAAEASQRCTDRADKENSQVTRYPHTSVAPALNPKPWATHHLRGAACFIFGDNKGGRDDTGAGVPVVTTDDCRHRPNAHGT